MSTIAVKKVKLGDNADTSKNFLIEVPAVADGTLMIKREDGTNVLSIDATGKAVIPGVVGTVAQVGGVPTGQVVERGSNANGTYVRFADGTQICTAVGSIPTTAIDNNFGIAKPHPAAFIGKPATNFVCSSTDSDSIQGYANIYRNGVGTKNATATELKLSGYTYHESIIQTVEITCVSIGRWF